MSTFYLDYINGSDANDGSSFASAWKTFTLGATAARIAPGDTIRVAKSPDPTPVGNSIWTTRPATDVYNTIKSSTNTSPIAIVKVGHGLVTGDIVNIRGHNGNTSANGIWKISRINDDAFYLDNSVGVGTGAASGNFRKCNWQCVELPAGTTFNINRTGHEGNWTSAMAGVTCTQDTGLSKEGRYSIRLACTTTATTGLAAYYATGDLNLSSYKQISFWFYSNLALNADDWKLCLCSDTAGSTIVYTASIPKIPQVNRWNSITVDIGSAMSTTIKSVALYQNVDKGVHNVYVNNILACKDSTSSDAITLNSLISPSSDAYGNRDHWYTITGINNNIISIGEYSTVDLSGRPGYYGSTEGSLATYKREFIMTDAVASTISVNASVEAGSVGNYITYSGGWNTSTNTQDGETWFGSYNDSGYGVFVSHAYIKLDRISTIRYYDGFRLYPANYLDINNACAISCAASGFDIIASSYCNLGYLSSNGCNISNFYLDMDYSTVQSITSSYASTNNSIDIGGSFNTFTSIEAVCGCSNSGIEMQGVSNYIDYIGKIQWSNQEGFYFFNAFGCVINEIGDIKYSIGFGINLNAANNLVINKIGSISSNGDSGININNSMLIKLRKAGTISNNTGYAIKLTNTVISGLYISDMTTSGNSLGSIYCTKIDKMILQNCYLGEAAEVSFFGGYSNYDSVVYSSCQDGDEDNHIQYFDCGLITSDTTTRHTASGISWKVLPAHEDRTIIFPMTISLAKIACNASSEVTFKVYCKKEHATQIGSRIVIYEGQLPGYTTQEDIKANDTDWEQLSVSFTPTKKGVVEILGEVWLTSSTLGSAVYFDDIEVTQA